MEVLGYLSTENYEQRLDIVQKSLWIFERKFVLFVNNIYIGKISDVKWRLVKSKYLEKKKWLKGTVKSTRVMDV